MNVEKIQHFCFAFYENLKHFVIARYINKMLASYTDDKFSLNREQINKIKDFYSPYKKISTVSHAFYTDRTGIFSPYYLPMDIYINDVDEYFNNRAESKAIDNKCYYYSIFSGIPQPEAVVLRIGGIWYSKEMQMISEQSAISMVRVAREVFAKQATSSCGGKGIKYISDEKGDIKAQLDDFLSYVKGDIVIQKPIKQHKDISALHPSSVNTMRIISLLTKDGVKIYSSVLKVGVGSAKVDNGSKGGVSCGITDDGKLKGPLFKLNGERFDLHPTSGLNFEGYKLPGFEKAKELVIKAHPMVPHFKLVSWDIAIDEKGEPIMVEANLTRGSSELHQLNNGPLFGEDTKKILDEVYGVKS